MASLVFLIFAAILAFAMGDDHQIQKRYTWRDGSPNLLWAENCDWSGGDIGNVKVTGDQCGQQCANKQGCTRFVWTKYNDGTCWLKSGSANQDQAIPYNGFGDYSVCGFMKGSTPTATGKTTRYWDCCKVSCGWSNKANVNAPVQSCQKDGSTAAGVDDKTGCDGGGAYTCNSNQPWAVNDNLAYGFAAAHLTGQAEGDWCCACYELTFTSGAASGKKLVVQVTNTGGDLGENHFDLQIPGGGVGIFNGCSSQWGAPGDGWGARNGGVSSRDECNQLPGELKPGCFWRFDWFKNADNPSINFQKVACPAELTAKSGCRRNGE